MPTTARGTHAFTLLAVVLIVAATTMPWSYVGHAHWDRVEWVPFTRLFRPIDVVLNILLFVPLGVALMAAGVGPALRAGRLRPVEDSPMCACGARRVRRTGPTLPILAGALLSLGIEIFQVFTHGRQPSVADLLANTLGTWIGARAAVRWWLTA